MVSALQLGGAFLQHLTCKPRFYVLENNLETLGRQLLFLSLALEPAEKMGLQEKSEIFLELMGNTLIRSQTAAYLQEKSDLFIRYVTDLDFQQAHLPILDLSALKFKERDQLEAIFRFWRNPDPRAFQIKQLWDLRLRQYLGTRYDSRRGVCDWDLTMKLHEHGAKIIGSREFFHWRDTGVAFELREAVYDIPNKSLASGRLLRHKGEPVPARGYWGDIATGPYVTFGIESEDAYMLKTCNGVPTKSAQEISLHNVTAMLHGLSYHNHYDPPASSDKEENSGSLQGGNDCAKLNAPNSPPASEGIQVHFLPLNCLSELHHKSRYQQLFNLIFFSCSMVHFLKPNLHLVSAPKATLVIEMTNFLPDLRKEQVSEFASRVASMVTGSGFVPAEVTDKKAFSLFQRGDREVEETHSEIPPLEMTEPIP
ncbi:dynein axonemal assembly factor 3 isoform X2 [Tiliqua scincoides]|uniref:dynein axonemal assembly factor 3 isoform X2 n=1 Tax=Tiliqua scincoides TaxID=71010 RepID=UPI003462D6C0